MVTPPVCEAWFWPALPKAPCRCAGHALIAGGRMFRRPVPPARPEWPHAPRPNCSSAAPRRARDSGHVRPAKAASHAPRAAAHCAQPDDQAMYLAIDREIFVEPPSRWWPSIRVCRSRSRCNSRSVARWAASSAASRSMPASASNNSNMRSVSISAIRGLRLGRNSTNPSAASTFMASRNGVRETPSAIGKSGFLHR